MWMQDEKGTVIGEKSMKNEEYKKLSIKEFKIGRASSRERV